MTILLFGNPDLPYDAVPIQIFPRLTRYFPDIDFRVVDPNELDLPKDGDSLVIIDTVEGLVAPRFISVDEIAALRARVTAHDFDLSSFLLLAKKLNKNIDIRIVGIPMSYGKDQAFEEIKPLLSSLA